MKLGLALSGGGFRASLFHLGVLACLADLGHLKSVQYLSTVSGGSIVGAAYYLKVKQLLEGTRPDGAPPSDEAYVTIIRELIDLFLRGVQQNIRMRTFLDPRSNIRMLRRDYSRSDHIGELYTRYFYKPIWDSMGRSLTNGNIRLRDLRIFPGGNDPGDVELYNRSAPYKIPVLIINATTLNCGHNWQFTAKYVGEPARRYLDPDQREAADTNRIFDRRYYDLDYGPPGNAINAKLDELYLGDAVAASACVPVLFHPMAIHDLYENDVAIQLVDGGVYDNQGIHALYDKEATHVLCSDASQQLADDNMPSTKSHAVLLRGNDVLMDAAREEELDALVRFLPGLTSAYLLHWNQDLGDASNDPEVIPPSPQVLDRLARIRTDLDSFHDIEAFALMYTGYTLCHRRMGRRTPQNKADRWRFWQIQQGLGSQRLIDVLNVSSRRLFKVFYLRPSVAWTRALAIVLPLLGLLGVVIVATWDAPVGWLIKPFSTVGTLVLTMIGLIAYMLASQNQDLRRWLKAIRWLRTAKNVLAARLTTGWLAWLPLALACLVCVPVWIHLNWFDPLYLQAGRLDELRRNRRPGSGKRGQP